MHMSPQKPKPMDNSTFRHNHQENKRARKRVKDDSLTQLNVINEYAKSLSVRFPKSAKKVKCLGYATNDKTRLWNREGKQVLS